MIKVTECENVKVMRFDEWRRRYSTLLKAEVIRLREG
jgi:hypothetical protein